MTRARSHFILFAILSSVLSSVATLFKVQGVKHLPPVLAAPVAFLFFGESLGPVQMVGALIVLLTSALISKQEKSPK